MSPSLLTRLREATASAHQQIEDQLPLPQACQEPALYRELIEGFFGYYEPVECRLAALSGWGDYDPNERRKTPWLLADLRALGLAEEEISRLPRCQTLPEVETTSQGFGCAYVLEGSTLGGRQISQWLNDSPIPEGARTFFASYGPQVGEKWKGFGAALEHFSRMGNAGEVIQGAQETFTTLSRWMKHIHVAA